MVYCHFQKYESNPAASVTHEISILAGGMVVKNDGGDGKENIKKIE